MLNLVCVKLFQSIMDGDAAGHGDVAGHGGTAGHGDARATNTIDGMWEHNLRRYVALRYNSAHCGGE